jgi:hypothetical protein
LYITLLEHIPYETLFCGGEEMASPDTSPHTSLPIKGDRGALKHARTPLPFSVTVAVCIRGENVRLNL